MDFHMLFYERGFWHEDGTFRDRRYSRVDAYENTLTP